MSMRFPEPLKLRVLRSSQTDAEQLDDELRSLFTANLNRWLGVFHSAWLTCYYRELVLVLDSVMFGLTVGRGRPSPGMLLLNLKFRDERRSSGEGNEGPPLTATQRTLLYLGHIVTPYLWNKATALLARCNDDGLSVSGGGVPGASRRPPGSSCDVYDPFNNANGAAVAGSVRSIALLWRLALQSGSSQFMGTTKALELGWKGLELANFATYIRHGAYRGALERVIGARLVYGDVRASRHVSFDYLNRHLIWSEVSDFVLFVLPLLQMGSVGRLVNKYLPMNDSIRGLSTVREDSSCPVCETTKESPVRCQVMPCRHTYCYCCVASRLGCSPEPRCYACSEPVRHVCFM